MADVKEKEKQHCDEATAEKTDSPITANPKEEKKVTGENGEIINLIASVAFY